MSSNTPLAGNPRTPARRFRIFPRLRLGGRWNLYAGAAVVGLVAVLSLLAPFITPYDPIANSLSEALRPPGPGHLMGTDNFGRDIFARVLYAGRIDLQIALFAVAVPLVTGILLGALAGYFGGWFDTLLMRTVDVVISFPFMVLIIAIITILGPGLKNMYIAIFLVGWSAYARIIRAEVLVLKKQEFVLAARVLGYGHGRIIFRHILPNAITPAMVFAMSDMVLCILLAASLSFLGLGVQPPQPEWGAMAAEGRNFMLQAWWITTMPGLAILVTGLGLSLIGDGLAEKLEHV